MIISQAIRNLVKPNWTRPELLEGFVYTTASGQSVSPETAKAISTVYRCANIISNDVAKMPLQQYVSRGGDSQRVRPDAFRRNMAYLVEVQPNRWQVPLVFRKTAMLWLLFWGNAYIWMPPGSRREMYVLPSNCTEPYVSNDGQVRYRLGLDGSIDDIPAVEVMHLMINSTDGLSGKGVLTYARETVGRRQGANEAMNKLYAQGLMPGAMAHFEGDLSKEARAKVQSAYSEAVSGSNNAGRLLVLDGKVQKFEVIPISANDMQFLQSIAATDAELANFFELPLYKLNMGKEAYNSNEQQNLDYLATTLDPYLVQWEQAAALRWLTAEEQAYSYWRFNRDSLLRTDAKTRNENLKTKVLSGQMEINEARQVEDLPRLAGGDVLLIPSNMAVMGRDGAIRVLAKETTGGQKDG